MKIYLSPSNQDGNPYSYGNTNEMVQCNRIAESAMKYLLRNGYEVKKAPQGQDMNVSIAESNSWGADLHIPIHTNAGGGHGVFILVRDKSTQTMKYAEPIYNAIKQISSKGSSHGIAIDYEYYPDGKRLGELHSVNATSVYVEAEFHDSADLAKWIVENVDLIGQAICRGVCIADGKSFVADDDALSVPETNGVHRRTGLYGYYFGSYYNESAYPTEAQMRINARYIYSYLSAHGWSLNAICALLGNSEHEGVLNPGMWQGQIVGGNGSGRSGYGLLQWTNFDKYTDWAIANGYSDPSEMDANLARVIYEVEQNIQWYGTGNYYGISFEEFSKSTESVRFLAIGFLLCYEKPSEEYQTEYYQNIRANSAEAWYTYLTTYTPSNPSDPSYSTKKRKGYNFVLMNVERRRRLWTRTHSYRR